MIMWAATGTPNSFLRYMLSQPRLVLSDETVKRLNETIDPHSDLFLRSGDVLVQRSNTSDLVGMTAVFSGPSDTYVYPDLMMRLRFRDNAMAHWFWRYANSYQGRRFFVRMAAGSTGSMPKISGEKLRHMLLPVPSLSERRAIDEALSDVDGLLGALEALIAKKRAIKLAAVQQLLTGKTRLPGFTGEWDKKRLGEIAHIQRGASPRPIDSPIWFDETSSVGWVRISDVTNSGMYLRETTQRLSTLGIQNSRPVPRGSLIMSICATVGRPIITAIDVCIHDGFVVFHQPQADSHFLFYVLSSIEDEWFRHDMPHIHDRSGSLGLETADATDLDGDMPPSRSRI